MSSASATGRTSNGAFTVLPLHAISGNRKYVVVTSCIQHECFIGITTGAASAHVSIILKSNYTMTIENQYPKIGPHFDSDLEEFETIHMFLNSTSLTGTIVESNNTIAVFSGGVYNYLSASIAKQKGVSIVCTEKGKSLTKMRPFPIYKGLKSVVGEPKSVSKLHKSSELLVEVDSKIHSDELLRCSRICEWKTCHTRV
uniref:IgGFc-binding protein N-terminal domain-containing protein n=1 Tax=Biomphalaria glabrata TaxID=6526 RepID=A0A2C9KU45_BIOGL